LGVYYVKKVTERDKLPFDPFLNVAYILIIGGILGARISYVLLHLDEFAGRWTDSFNPFSSAEFGIAGLNLYGGVVLAILAAWAYCYFKKLNILQVFDYFTPTLGLGIGITRIGCFLNGCCFGTPTDLPWGISFPLGSLPYAIFGEAHLHPAQLYSSFYGLVLFVALHFVVKNRKFFGQAVAILFMAEAIFRFVIEYVRYYEDAMYFSLGGFQPTYNQVVSVLLFAIGLVLYLVRRKSTIANATAGSGN
ncbi:MAG: prolipoprotein diacylglyceryl transferase, partial [Candidatus Zixiibacteriota bacterium]